MRRWLTPLTATTSGTIMKRWLTATATSLMLADPS